MESFSVRVAENENTSSMCLCCILGDDAFQWKQMVPSHETHTRPHAPYMHYTDKTFSKKYDMNFSVYEPQKKTNILQLELQKIVLLTVL